MYRKEDRSKPDKFRNASPRANIWRRVKRFMNGELRICWIRKRVVLPIAVMVRALRIGKHMFIIRLLLSEPPFYCIKLQVKNAIWIMRFWQLIILSMRCLLRNIYYLLSVESSKVFILLFLPSILLCWYMIAGRLNIFHICTAIFVPVGPTGMKYVAFVVVSIPKHCQPM